MKLQIQSIFNVLLHFRKEFGQMLVNLFFYFFEIFSEVLI